jgi:hypothetical protein
VRLTLQNPKPEISDVSQRLFQKSGAYFEAFIPFCLMVAIKFVQPGSDTGPENHPVWKARY